MVKSKDGGYVAREFIFRLALSQEQVLAIYSGVGKVLVRTEDGLRVQINAIHLRQFTTRDGIYGRFRMLIDEQNRMIGVEKIG